MEDKRCRLEIPSASHEGAYVRMIERWEQTGEKVAPSLLSRYSSKAGKNVSYSQWLEWCEDDRTTGSMLSTGCPCTLYFLLDDANEIVGAMEINHARTHRGHMHSGIVPWKRGQGYGTVMLKLALDICREMGMTEVEIVPHKENRRAVQTILNNGGVLTEEFFEEGRWSERYTIAL